jgi:hypothetical protein
MPTPPVVEAMPPSFTRLGIHGFATRDTALGCYQSNESIVIIPTDDMKNGFKKTAENSMQERVRGND